MGVFTKLLVPETKGVPIEAIEDTFRKHWFWKRVMAHTDEVAARDDPHHLEDHEPVCKVTTPSSLKDPKAGLQGVHKIPL